MSVTFETSHPEILPLKDVALLNMFPMLVTAETSHPEILPLKEVAPLNM